LVHSGRNYSIIREQRYARSSSGAIKPNHTVLTVAYKGDDGQQEFLEGNAAEFEVKKILPEDLSHYFFFNGERLDVMKEEIDKGKSAEFGRAVRGILGLSAFQEALTHLKRVIKDYDSSFDVSGDATLARFTKEIEDCDEKIEKIDARLAEIFNEQTLTHDKCVSLGVKIKENEKSEQYAKEAERLVSSRNGLVSKRNNSVALMLKAFNDKANNYFAKKLIKDALDALSKADKLDKGIPDIHQRTIDYLIDRRECICGTHIEAGEPGNKAFRTLNELVQFIPPQSVGAEIRNFVDQCKLRTDIGETLFDEIAERFGVVRGFEGDYSELQSNIDRLNEELAVMQDVGVLQRDKMSAERYLDELKSESAKLNQQRGDLANRRESKTRERQELNLRYENNRRIETYKAYAQSMHDSIDTTYKERETETRIQLEAVVNEIFRNIYDGGFSLAVDEKYGIQIIVNDYEGYNSTVETSTAQSLSVIFAFIAGVTKMARENSKNEENSMSTSEPYPLVMDAPLSAFDKTRIKTICAALPKAAEQVIVFIKDTDGELAEQHMGEKVGVRYIFNKRSEFESYLSER
jgi:DNA sulfur modification protein DndD